MRPLKERITVTIDPDVVDTLRVKAKENCRPLSQYINIVLKWHIQREEKDKDYDFLVPGDVKPNKVRLSVTLDNDLLQTLREKADYDCRPLSQYINLVLRKHIDEQKG